MLPEAEFLDEIQAKPKEISSLLFTFTSTALPWDFYFFKLSQPLTVSTVQLLYTIKETGGKPDRKPYPPSLWFKKFIQKPQVWDFCPETSTNWIRLQVCMQMRFSWINAWLADSGLRIQGYIKSTEAKFLDVIGKKVFRVFFLAIHSHLC